MGRVPITFQRDLFSDELEVELDPLAQAHNKEIGGQMADLRVRVPRELYAQLEPQNMLRIYTLREDGDLKGYNIFAMMVHPQYSKLIAQHDSMFVDPSVRAGFNAVRFLRWCDEQLKADGVAFVTQSVTAALDYSPILRRLSYAPHETIYIKRLN